MALTNGNGVWPAPLLDDTHHAQVQNVDIPTGIIIFDNGVRYQFRNLDLLRMAVTVKYTPPHVAPGEPMPINNICIARTGDGVLSAILRKGWARQGSPHGMWNQRSVLHLMTSTNKVEDEYKIWNEFGMNMNSYQTYHCDAIELTLVLHVPGARPGSIVAMEFWASWDGRKAKATSIEAIIGAVELDSESEAVTKVVMRHMGFYWPENPYQVNTMQAAIGTLCGLGVIRKREE
ncbi:hypothetical protein CBER1_06774 [Cercospora berteroae]|uniref:Uncharacterized protein n=1 Tax=Cercospora berteroae TaxID=357750 RepID=A0A2S6BRD4_9PEZI|nr:hypothetical protein CBER1_06774 [Cercospora berteroae]